ncbi:N-6 DNA methylase [Candidatus Poribacteria bacterium]|nr:N-6 DNA methylase [Candidatus Poribacteria bacterium]
MADRVRENLIFAHQEWIGFVQPVGLVVAPTVMVDAQVVPDRNISGRQRDFCELLEEEEDGGTTTRWRAPDLRKLFLEYLEWEEGDLEDTEAYKELEISLPELEVVLSPTWAVPSEDSDDEWMMLIRVEEGSANFDKPPDDTNTWNATRHARFERLLRETSIPIGLLCNDECIRLVYAPGGESSGHITFNFSEMASPAGRPILAAFDMLLSAYALFIGSEQARLPALLAKSRDAQVEVSTQLSRQVLAALYELLRGFVAADARKEGRVLMDLAWRRPDDLYRGLITALMRLVFVLYTEDRGLMPEHRVYQQHYSLGGLFARLRADAAAWPDTMDQRFGAWAQLLSLFRLIHGGGRHKDLSFVARKGGLFDPERFPFLEGRLSEGGTEIPMVSDATVWEILKNLMMLNGERLSYRTLDVEQIGSVYEAIMGFQIDLTTGRSIAVRSKKRTGAAVIVDLDGLLRENGSRRAKALRDATEQSLTGKAATALRNAVEPADIVAALDNKVDRDATPDILPRSVPILQPTSERRRSGSHYTPRTLTEPIVSEALQPIFERLGPAPKPRDILELKILDPATGSGAFLVEACRQLAAKLVDAWGSHGGPSDTPADEDRLIQALRLVAEYCLYGVDKNPMAIDLARLSLWLATFAKDREFTFIDHALRPGDSLVGLTRRQIEGFHWKADAPLFQMGLETTQVREHVNKISELRQRIREIVDEASEQELRGLLEEAQRELQSVRRFADLVLAAFFEGEKTKEREQRRDIYANLLIQQHGNGGDFLLKNIKPPLEAFHWEIEFPEVFERENPGFDAIIGNPPFAGKNTIAHAMVAGYPDWLKQLHIESHGNADLVAHFFRRAFNLLRQGGTLGLIATNTIGQGDTRSTGLCWICKNGGTIYAVRRRKEWPGEAAVVVSFVHIVKGTHKGLRMLDSREVETISAFLFYDGGHDDPERLLTNARKSFGGSYPFGMGFTFDDTDSKGIATPISEMLKLIKKDRCNQEVIFPYIGGAEVNNSPVQAHHRYVINFGKSDEEECWESYPELMAIVNEKVKPQRLSQNDQIAKKKWWQFKRLSPELNAAISGLDRVLVIPRTSNTQAMTFLPSGMIFDQSLVVFPFTTFSAFTVLQSQCHQLWSAFFGSSMKDDPVYTPSDCFETFPFPENWETQAGLEATGKDCYEFRAALMIRNDEGLTKTYNRFHDHEENDIGIAKLRELHTAMDRSILDAYGWCDIPTDCDFLLDFEIDEEEWGRRKKPWRYRWPDETRDEVLARLLALNAERAREERLAGRDV